MSNRQPAQWNVYTHPELFNDTVAKYSLWSVCVNHNRMLFAGVPWHSSPVRKRTRWASQTVYHAGPTTKIMGAQDKHTMRRSLLVFAREQASTMPAAGRWLANAGGVPLQPPAQTHVYAFEIQPFDGSVLREEVGATPNRRFPGFHFKLKEACNHVCHPSGPGQLTSRLPVEEIAQSMPLGTIPAVHVVPYGAHPGRWCADRAVVSGRRRTTAPRRHDRPAPTYTDDDVRSFDWTLSASNGRRSAHAEMRRWPYRRHAARYRQAAQTTASANG